MLLEILKLLLALTIGITAIPAMLAVSHRIERGNWHWWRDY
ncbi:hypothetical protein B0E38_06490 [Streptomyces sp. 111WW2]|nr:hypothetical protein [Streptomyces sp. 111WW2]PSK48013.1 hypothetical protein B0E38_06490 [Streptomyces sp. 111WW2]